MKASELVSLWSAPDNSRLTAKQYSFRLPVHVAAKLSALCDLYPNKTRTEIVGDLLASALAEVEKALPSYQGREITEFLEYQSDEPVYETLGPAIEFRHLADEHYRALEKELGNPNPRGLYDPPGAPTNKE